MQKGTPNANWPATPSSESSSSNHNTKDEEHISCFLDQLSLDPACWRIFKDETKMLGHHHREMGDPAVPIFQQALNEDPHVENERQWSINNFCFCIFINLSCKWLQRVINKILVAFV
jgi:hypothetical protein